MANAAAGLSAAMAAQVVWTPVDVISQRLMAQGGGGGKGGLSTSLNACKYVSGVDAFRKILRADGIRGLYRGFGISILTYAPSNAVWWASYSVAQRVVWSGVGCVLCKIGEDRVENGGGLRPDAKTVMAVQGVSAAISGGVSALITMPLDTIKTRLLVLDCEENNGRKGPSFGQTVRNLMREGGWTVALLPGFGPKVCVHVRLCNDDDHHV